MDNKNKDPKDSIIIVTVILILCYLFTSIKELLIIGVAISLASLISLKILSVVNFVLLRVTKVIGLLGQKIVLILIFFLVLTPLALLYQVFRDRDMMLKLKKDVSTFDERNEVITKILFEKLW